jgi:hypothetical protein
MLNIITAPQIEVPSTYFSQHSLVIVLHIILSGIILSLQVPRIIMQLPILEEHLTSIGRTKPHLRNAWQG